MDNKQITFELTLKITTSMPLWIELINKKRISIKTFLGLNKVEISPDIILHPLKKDNE